ncbi:MAG: protein phosphatase 2C domain-containing protein [Butyrivibrio sp.]|nr:protein phosphatase 2C domain-containing protein [Butyrivibrio sp.]
MTIYGSEIKRVLIGNAQNQGARPYQEDSFGFTELSDSAAAARGFMAIVADGMGGLTDSGQISSHAVNFLIERFKEYDGFDPADIWLDEMARSLNVSASEMRTGGGSTLAAVLCAKDGIYWCNVGDSRIYLLRRGGLYRITEDGDYLTDLLGEVLNGEFSFEEASEDDRKTALTQYIGSGKEIEPEVNRKPLLPDPEDTLLICSDGVYNALGEDELAKILEGEPEAAAAAIEREVLGKGFTNQDNFTAVILKFE